MCAGVCPPALWSCQKRFSREEKGWQHWQLSGLRKKRNCLWLAFRNLLWFDISGWQLITALQLTCCCCCCCCRFRNGRNQVLVPIANCKIHRKLHNFHSTTRWGRTPAERTSMNECETGPHGLTRGKLWVIINECVETRPSGIMIKYFFFLGWELASCNKAGYVVSPYANERNKWITLTWLTWATTQPKVFVVCCLPSALSFLPHSPIPYPTNISCWFSVLGN